MRGTVSPPMICTARATKEGSATPVKASVIASAMAQMRGMRSSSPKEMPLAAIACPTVKFASDAMVK